METLIPGATLFRGPSGPVLRDVTGELFGVALPDSTIESVRAALGPDDAAAPGELAAFREAGHLGKRLHWPENRRVVAVLAEDEFAAALRSAGAEPVVVTPSADAVLDLAPAAFCAWHDGPAPEHWLELDVLREHGIAFQRVSREGRHVLFEPAGVSHRDVRSRRLAAAGSGHEHLLAYWAGTGALHGDDAPDAAERLLIATLAAKDLTVYTLGAELRTGPLIPTAIPARRRLRVLDLDTGAISDHPVLPVPATAP